MQYTVVHLDFSSTHNWQQDVLFQQLADIGFEAFDGADAYIQSAQYDPAALDAVLLQNEDIRLLSVEQCPDEDWNATWESEHPMEELPLGIKITPHCAFGAGHHETTSMMIAHLIESESLLYNAHVLDMGCGTGVLGIFAAHLGASHVTSVDIDDKSVSNTRENIALNTENYTRGQTPRVVLDRFTLLCQGNVPDGQYNLILANIHRNILLAQMSDYARNLLPNGQLWLSGFYEEDVSSLLASAALYHLQPIATFSKGDWRMLCLNTLK